MWSAFFHSDDSTDSPGDLAPPGVEPPVAMTVAGSDNSAGAGLQADLKTFSAHGVYGLTATTCVVSEVPGLVSMIEALSPKIVADQIRLGFEAFPVRAVKTGMLFSSEIIAATAEALRAARAAAKPDGRPFYLVVDPVMVASSGDPLLQPEAVEAIKSLLFPLADLVTPNLDEAAVLLDLPREALARIEDLEPAARALAARHQAPFLLKGGHLKVARAIDLLVHPPTPVEPQPAAIHFEEPFIEGLSPHGTGCTYAAAITARLALGESLVDAVGRAKRFITAAIRQHLRWPANRTICLNHGPRPPRLSP